MRYKQSPLRLAVYAAAALLEITLLATGAVAQAVPPAKADDAVAQGLSKYPGLVPELGHLIDRLKREVQFPSERHASSLLPRLPGATSYYAAVPNYGEAAHQALAIFREELQQSAPLRDWWQHGDMAKTAPQVEGFIEKFYGFSQFLGDEWVISGEAKESTPGALFVATLRKPGFKPFLDQMLNALPAKSQPGIRIFDPQELARAEEPVAHEAGKPSQLVVLVRPDFVIAGTDLRTVQAFNKRFDVQAGEFAATPFGQRLNHAYRDGTSVIAAADLHKLMSQIPADKQAKLETLKSSGFNDVKYLVWDHKNISGQPVGEMELSFINPRHGAAAWLAAPAPLRSLDFASPTSAMVASIRLKNLAEIFDDIRSLSSSTPDALGALPQMEQALHFSLRDDVLSQLEGEITVAVDDLTATPPQWKAILRVNDSQRLQGALDKLLRSVPGLARQFKEEEITYHSLTVPSAQKPTEIIYAVVDQYLVIASSRKTAGEAIQLYKSGSSFAKSPTFLDLLPPGYSHEVSALLYEDASAMSTFRLRQLSPEVAEAMSHLTPGSSRILYCAYGEERAIRTVSAGGGADAAGILVGAAIAIPNLIRAKGAADESAAVATLRSLDAAQAKYSGKYLQYGYARDLATLGPDPSGGELKTSRHAGLIDSDLGNAKCTAGVWCEKSGYRFTVTAMCPMRSCQEFVAVATPISIASGARSFCSTSDGVIRFQLGVTLISPVSTMECKQWQPLH